MDEKLRDEMTPDERAMYDALPPAKQREVDRIYRRAQDSAAQLRAARERYAALCDEIEAALKERAAAAGHIDGNPPAHQEPVPQYA